MHVTTISCELLLDVGALLGEGACWDGAGLWWVDILGGKLHRFQNGQDLVYHTGQPLGTVAPVNDSEVIVALQRGIYRYNTAQDIFTLLADPEPELPVNRLNDGKCDPMGRFWVGSMSHIEDGRVAGSLYRLDDRGLACMCTGVAISNGMGWSPDGRLMYYIDTPTRRVDVFDFDMTEGQIAHRRTVCDFDHTHGAPDGMTVDDEGCLWVAEWGGSRVSRWTPAGECVAEIILPVSRVTSVAFGEGDTLYITTAQGNAMDMGEAEPHAGSLFVAHVGVGGRPGYRFAY